MKRIFSLLIASTAVAVQAMAETIVRAIPNAASEVVESIEWRGNYVVKVNDGAYLYPTEPEGHPLLPYTIVEIPLPLGAEVKEVSTEIGSWETLKSGAPVLPIQALVQMTESPETPAFVPLDPESVSDGFYPKEVGEYTGVITKDGHVVVTVKLTPFKWTSWGAVFEQAKDVSIRVAYDRPPTARLSFAAPQADTDEKPIMLILAPEDLYPTWEWYGAERKTAHPEVTVEVVNTETIYEAYPFKDVRVPKDGPASVADNESRYPSESIWKWLHAYYQDHPKLRYLLLGGAWLDVTDPNVHYLQDGTEITLKNAIPSMRVNPRKDTMNPTDMYYACLENGSDDAVHHWDANNNGVYIEADGNEEKKCNMLPDISVSRITAKPMPMNESVEINPAFTLVGGSRILNQHQLITNFLWKVNAAERKDFKGNHKLAITSSSLNYKTLYLSDSLMQRTENEFFDGAPNMYAPEHVDNFRDAGPAMRRHASEFTALYRPVLETVSYHEPGTYSKNATKETFSSVFNDFDRELGTVNGHGWAGGSGWFSANTFSTCKGLTKINVVGVSCETGYLDIYGNQNGKSVANLCLGESGQANATATGGIIASVNNTRLGWSTMNCRTYRATGVSASMHYYMYWGVSQGMNAGDAWKFMCHNYYRDCGNKSPGSTGGQCYTQEMLFGDPLIRLEPIADYTWDGVSAWSGVYSNATFTANSSASLAVQTAVGAMSMTVTQPESAAFTLSGTGSVKVMRGMTVSGGNLEIGVSGGLGGVGDAYNDNETENAKRPNKLVFSTPGTVTFDNTATNAYFYVPALSNVREMTFAGGGAIIDTDDFDETLTTLTFRGKDGFDGKSAPANVIRANAEKKEGLLARFMPLELTNTSLTLETYDAFNGFGGENFATLDRAKLTFRNNRWRGLADADYAETIRGALALTDSILASDYPASIYLDSPTLNVQGDSAIETTHGGAFKLKGEMKINLSAGSTLALDGEIQPLDNASMTITGSGRVIVKNTKGLAGRVRVESGITLELVEFPLVNVTELKFADKTMLVLPAGDTFNQILPMSSALFKDEGATVTVRQKNSVGVETPITVEFTQTGAVFDAGSILSWAGASGIWTEQTSEKPWMKNGASAAFNPNERAYFPDLRNIAEAVVTVGMPISSPTTCFGNSATTYRFRRAATSSAEAATITFSALSIGGKTIFELPTVYTTRLYLAGGSLKGTEIVSPIVEIAAGGTLEARHISSLSNELTDLRVTAGGTFVLSGEHAMSVSLFDGATLKAVNGAALVWNENTSIVWPENGKALVDVSDFKATRELQPIITGVKADMAFLRRFTTNDENVSLAINEAGDVCLVQCSEESPNWLNDGTIKVGASEEVVFDSPKRFATLTFTGETEEATLNLTIAEGGSLLTDELKFDGIGNVKITDFMLGTGKLFAATNTVIAGKSSGVLSMTANDVVYFENPNGAWSLAEGAQGIIYFGVTDEMRAERHPILTIDANRDWPIGGLTVSAYDSKTGAAREDFAIMRERDTVYLVPPAPHAEISGGANMSGLNWIAYDGKPVAIENWANVYAAEIESTSDASVLTLDVAPKTKLSVGGVKLEIVGEAVLLPRELVVDTEVTVKGPILPALDYVAGSGTLILDTGSVTEIIIPGSAMPIGDETKVEIAEGSTLRFAHQSYFQNTAADFSRISGEGTIELKNISNGDARFIMPDNKLMFSKDLSFALNTVLELQKCHIADALTVPNLSGSGSFGYGLMNSKRLMEIIGTGMNVDKFKADYAAGVRVMKAIQSKVTEWSGTLPAWFALEFVGIKFDAALVVSGSEESPSFARRLVYSGISNDAAGRNWEGDTYGNDHQLTIESSGCLELNGYWNGKVQNDGILVIGPKAVIKDKTIFAGKGQIATLGHVIDLKAYGARFANYTLASGSYGEIHFAATDFAVDQEIVPLVAGFELGEKNLLLVAENAEGVSTWQKVTAANLKDGKLFWLGSEVQEAEALNLTLESGENDFATLIGDTLLSAVPALTIHGTEGAATLDTTFGIANFKGVLTLDGATVKLASPLKSTLAANPTGKLVFVVDNPKAELELMKLADDFTYDPTKFTVEVVDASGEKVDTFWTWTAQDGVLKYVLTNPATSAHMPRAFKFDQNMSGWGQNSNNLGSQNLDKFVPSRNGFAITKTNPYGGDFEIGTHDWTVSWVARLSPTVNGVHFALGTASGGGFALTTAGADKAAISRWTGTGAATRLIEADVPMATKRFNAYALTFRNGVYTFYVNGKEMGTVPEVDGAPAYPVTINWQFFTIHGSLVGNTANGSAGAIDDFRLYDVAVGEKMIRAIAAEFPAWPELFDAKGEIASVDVSDLDNAVYLTGSGEVHLTSRPESSGVATLEHLSGDMKIVIESGVELIVEMSATNREPLKGHEVVIEKGGRLVLKQTSDMIANGQSLSGTDLHNIKGTGTLEFRSENCQYKLKLPSSRNSAIVGPKYWDERLSVCINTQVQLYSSYAQTTPLILRNLSGSGSFYHYGSTELNYVELYQTCPLEFTGTWPTEARVTIVNLMRVPKVLFR